MAARSHLDTKSICRSLLIDSASALGCFVHDSRPAIFAAEVATICQLNKKENSVTWIWKVFPRRAEKRVAVQLTVASAYGGGSHFISAGISFLYASNELIVGGICCLSFSFCAFFSLRLIAH